MKNPIKKSALILSILVLCASIAFVSLEYYKLSKPGLIVLLYHRIVDNDKIKSKYNVTVDNFREHLKILERHGFTPVLPQNIIGAGVHELPEKPIILSFDDGTADHYDTVFPILKQNGYGAVFFVVAKYLNYKTVLNENQVREMSMNGMEIGSHSFSHPFLETLKDDDLLFELKKSKGKIEEITSKAVVSFAPPGGWYNEKVVEIAKTAGYEAFFSCEIGKNDLNEEPYVFKRIEVLGDMSNKKFEDLLEPSLYLLGYKIVQSIKFFLHDAIGIENYLKFGQLVKKLNFYSQDHNTQIKYARS